MDNEYQRIEAYLEGSLSQAETEAFELELKQNEDLRISLKEHKAAHAAAEFLSYKYLKENHVFNTPESELKKKKTVRIFSILKVAASLVVLFAAGMTYWVNQSYNSTQLLAEYQSFAISSGQRSASGIVEEDRYNAAQDYVAKEYQKVIDRLETKQVKGQQLDRQEVYFLIYSYIQTSSFEKAAQITEIQLDSSNIADQYNKDWIEVQLALGANDVNTLKQRLNSILENTDHPYIQDAQTLLKKVQSPFFDWVN